MVYVGFEREDTVEQVTQFEYSQSIEITTELMSELEQYLFFRRTYVVKYNK